MTRPPIALAEAATLVPMSSHVTSLTTADADRHPPSTRVFRLQGAPAVGASAGAPSSSSHGVDEDLSHVAAELAVDDDGVPTGEVTAWPSIYEEPYRMGAFTWHELQAGAFGESTAAQGGAVPIYVQHGWDWTEQAPIGHTTKITEARRESDDHLGMRIEGRLYVDTDTGLSVARSLAAGALREWSLGYRILEHTVLDEDDRVVLKIARAELLECSVVLRGANPLTSTEHAAGAPNDDTEARDGEADDPETDPDQTDDLADLAASSPSFRAALRRRATTSTSA